MLKACARMGESEKVESWVEKMFEAMPMHLVGESWASNLVCCLQLTRAPDSTEQLWAGWFPV